MPNEIFVPLSKPEMAACRQAAAFRWQMARASGVANQRRDKDRSDEDIDFLGVRAEMAVSKLYDIEYSPHHLGVDDGVDMYCGDVSIDVKSTFYQHGSLVLKAKRWANADLYVLVTATANESLMRVVGGVTQHKLLADSTIENLGHGEGLVLEQDKLGSPSAIWRYLKSAQFQNGYAESM
jgi:hypothetical protein